jgi:hypothetical protein
MTHDRIQASTQSAEQPDHTHDPYANEVIDLMADLHEIIAMLRGREAQKPDHWVWAMHSIPK